MGKHGTLKAALSLVTAMAAGWASNVYAANEVYLVASGATQGAIAGDVTSPGFEGSIQVVEFHHLVHSETGTQVHEPVVFTKLVDRSTPNLYRAFNTSENLDLLFRFTRVNPQNGTVEVYYTVHLLNAHVVGIEPIRPNLLDPANGSLPFTERIRVVYQSIQITWAPTGSTYVLTP